MFGSARILFIILITIAAPTFAPHFAGTSRPDSSDPGPRKARAESLASISMITLPSYAHEFAVLRLFSLICLSSVH